MHPQFRAAFNAAFHPSLHGRLVEELQRRLGTSFDFRLAETPLFLDEGFMERAAQAANEIVDQLSSPALIDRMSAAVPDRWNVPGIDHLPNIAQVDFAVVEQDGRLVPRLVELQGFPSLTAMQVIQCDVWNDLLQEMPGLEGEWSCWFSGLDRTSFLELARRTIVGGHDPREVVLLDLDPHLQKTRPDFEATRQLFGVRSADPGELTLRGRQLFRGGDRVRRIYNRVVFDELMAKGRATPFDYREAIDVEWVPHPNWYWIWSKYSLPFLDHPAVPRAFFASEGTMIPDDLSGYVLKPLFSFAGGGVNVEPSRADVDAIPEEQRYGWCLQEKIEYAPALRAADGGGVKVEIRMMFFRPDDEARLRLCQNLVRLSRGKMLGVDFNKQFTWVGSSVGLHRP